MLSLVQGPENPGICKPSIKNEMRNISVSSRMVIEHLVQKDRIVAMTTFPGRKTLPCMDSVSYIFLSLSYLGLQGLWG